MKNFLHFLLTALFVYTYSNVSFAQTDQKISIWDFGAEQFDAATYNNMLDDAAINAWYDSSVTGITYSVGQADSSNNKLPGNIDMSGGLSWVGNGDASDRLRTSNTNLTRYDDSVGATGVTGRVYANGNSSDGAKRYFTLSMTEGDQVSIKALSHGGAASLTFEHSTDPTIMSVSEALPTDLTDYTFTAVATGDYKFYESGGGKLSVYRITQQEPIYVTLLGAVDISAATDIPNNYEIVFTNGS